MPIPVTGLYAGVLALILIWLSFGAGAMRGKAKVSVGDGGNIELLEKIRRHGNAVEYVPMAVVLLGIAELNGAGATFLHVLGIMLVVARIAHPLGLKADNMGHPLRLVGAGLTTLMMLIAAGYVIWQSVGAMTG